MDKLELSTRPAAYQDTWPGEFDLFAWQDFVCGIPQPLLIATTFKPGNIPNASLLSWCGLSGGGSDTFLCVFASVDPDGHFYQTLRETGCCVLGFYDAALHPKAMAVTRHNDDGEDEIAAARLTQEPAQKVHAPRIKECFLQLECEYVWDHPLHPALKQRTVAVRVVHVAIDSARADDPAARYGADGFAVYLNTPRSPRTGALPPFEIGTVSPVPMP